MHHFLRCEVRPLLRRSTGKLLLPDIADSVFGPNIVDCFSVGGPLEIEGTDGGTHKAVESVARVERQNCKQVGTSPHIVPLAQAAILLSGEIWRVEIYGKRCSHSRQKLASPSFIAFQAPSKAAGLPFKIAVSFSA